MFRSSRLVGVVQFLDKVVDVPVVVQCVDKMVDVPVVKVLGHTAGAVLAVMDVAVIIQRLVVVSRTVEVPQIQFIAPICGHSSSQQRQVRTVQTVQLSPWVAVYGGEAAMMGFSAF